MIPPLSLSPPVFSLAHGTYDPPLSLALLLLLSLEVLVAEVGCGTADEHEGVEAEAEAGGIAGVCGGDCAGLGCLGGWVAGLYVG